MILIVEDDITIAGLFKRAIQGANLGICWIVISGEELMSIIDRNEDEIQLILLDLKLKGSNGHSCLARLREIGSPIPVVVVSGNPTGIPEDVRADPTVREIVWKPILPTKLVEIVKKYMLPLVGPVSHPITTGSSTTHTPLVEAPKPEKVSPVRVKRGRRMRDLTPLVIVGIPLLLAMIDVCLYYWGGNEATISKVLLDLNHTRPLVGLSTVYSFGVLIGHLFFPTFADQSPPPYEVIARMFVILSPTVYTMIIIYFGNGSVEAHKKALESGGQLVTAAYMIAVGIGGGFIGKYGLPQHVLPREIVS